eukprot:3722018-Pyramimonas_sp.AAC.1
MSSRRRTLSVHCGRCRRRELARPTSGSGGAMPPLPSRASNMAQRAGIQHSARFKLSKNSSLSRRHAAWAVAVLGRAWGLSAG